MARLLYLALIATAFLVGQWNFCLATTIGVRNGDHPGFGRIVFELPEGSTATAVQRGDRVLVRFLGGTVVDRFDPELFEARNLRRSDALMDGMNLIVAHGAHLRALNLGDRLVVDLLDAIKAPDPAGDRKSPPSLTGLHLADAAPMPTADTTSTNAMSAGVTPAPTMPPPAPTTPSTTPFLPVVPGADSGPTGLSRQRPATTFAAPVLTVAQVELPAVEKAPQGSLALAATSAGMILSMPFSAETGAASFRRGEWSYVVFDERRPIDLSNQRENPIFAQATLRLLADATVLRFKSDPARGLSLSHVGVDWKLTVGDAAPRSFRPHPVGSGVMLPATDPGRVVAMPDPEGGGTLLVGTLRQAGPSVAEMHAAAAFILWPTWLGIVVEPLLDAIQLHVAPDGFLLTAGVGGSLALSDTFMPAEPDEIVNQFSRQFSLPALPTEILLGRLQEALRAAAGAPAQSRTDKRLAVAQSLLALGMGIEAQGVMAAAAREDPRSPARPDVIAAAAVAALLAGRVGEGEGILDERLSSTDEVAFWRGIRAAMMAQDIPAAAAALAPRVGLLKSYPSPLRDRLMALVGETLAAGGQGVALGTLEGTFPSDRHLALARAMTADAGTPSLASLDILANSPDRRMRARAAGLAAESRLARGLADPGGTADALEHLLYAWREDGTEIALRERVAALRSQGGAPRPALALLRETARLWPERATELQTQMAAVLETAVAPDARPVLSPLEFATLVEGNVDLLPAGPAGERLAEMLAERLDTLELPERAATTLGNLAAKLPPGVARATFGTHLASLRLMGNDAPAALLALRDSEVAGLPAALHDTRELVRAQAQLAQNDRDAALVTLAPLSMPAASVLRATLLERARDWAGAGQALDSMLNALPPDGLLDQLQATLVLRTASDAAQARDETRLQSLQQRFQERMPGLELARLLELLTARPVRETADLTRAGHEANLARQLPGQLNAITAGNAGLR